MRNIVLIGRLSHPDTNGNSHSSVEVIIDGVRAAYVNDGGSYGRYYEQQAWEWLKGSGLIASTPAGNIDTWCRENDVAFYSTCATVKSRKYL